MIEKTDVDRKLEEGNDWYVTDHFDSYQNWPLVLGRRLNTITKWIEEYLEESNPEHVSYCDLGCGDGFYLSRIVKEFPKLRHFATDYNPLRIKRAQTRFPTVSFSQQDILKMNFPNHMFDIVFLSQVIEHIREDIKALKEIYRVLKPNGILILGTPNEGSAVARLRDNIIQKWIRKKTDHVNFYREKELRKIFESCGFEIQQIMREHFLIPYTTIDTILSSNKLTHSLLLGLSKLFPSQTSGYYFVLRKLEAR